MNEVYPRLQLFVNAGQLSPRKIAGTDDRYVVELTNTGQITKINLKYHRTGEFEIEENVIRQNASLPPIILQWVNRAVYSFLARGPLLEQVPPLGEHRSSEGWSIIVKETTSSGTKSVVLTAPSLIILQQLQKRLLAGEFSKLGVKTRAASPLSQTPPTNRAKLARRASKLVVAPFSRDVPVKNRDLVDNGLYRAHFSSGRVRKSEDGQFAVSLISLDKDFAAKFLADLEAGRLKRIEED